MQSLTPYTVAIDAAFSGEELLKGVWLVIIHATRIPPHVGMIAGEKYHSLTIKGQEVNIAPEALIRNNTQRKIPSLFIKIKPHATFSNEYLKEHFISNVCRFPKVAPDAATCLSPVKLFFEEVYNVETTDAHSIFELLPKLEAKGLIESSSAMFIEEKAFQLPLYSIAELNTGIRKAAEDAAQALHSLKTTPIQS